MCKAIGIAMSAFLFAIAFFATILGAICGIGGGIIIKPVMDATTSLSVSTINFLSSCAVFSMAVISLWKSRNGTIPLETRKATYLALGSIFGGILGQDLFQYAKASFVDEKFVGALQAIIILITTLLILLFSLVRARISTLQLEKWWGCVLIGIGLGTISSFLGIGGGPINIVVLTIFFSMDVKTCALNSIYIILFSQGSHLLHTIIMNATPEFEWPSLLTLVAGGIAGGMVGSYLLHKFKTTHMNITFRLVLILISLISLHNYIIFSR